MKKAAILIADGFEESEALVPYDLLCRAGVEAALISVSGSGQACGSQNVIIENLEPMENYPFDQADALILPGGSGGYDVLRTTQSVLDEIRVFADSGRLLGAICASGALLGELGLLVGKKYTCYPTMNADFGGNYQRQPAVIDGNIVTGIGPGGAFPFGFALVEKLVGQAKVDELKQQTCWLF